MSDGIADAVRRYYDYNTLAFERFGEGGAVLHRAVWGEGVTDRAQAFAFIDRRIGDEIAALGSDAPRVLDLGCGLGASLMHQARSFPRSTGVGVTLSPLQASRATTHIARAGLADRIRCVEADFTELSEALGTFDLAFAIESFAHCPNTAAFFASAAARVRPGGRLVVCDDFQARPPRSPRETRWLEAFRAGWMVRGLTELSRARTAAEHAGFRLVADRDFTDFLELRRARDRLLAALLFIGKPLSIQNLRWKSWEGGDALQRALEARLVEYRFVTFERAG
jgi:SAM-dependent methyltransferase